MIREIRPFSVWEKGKRLDLTSQDTKIPINLIILFFLENERWKRVLHAQFSHNLTRRSKGIHSSPYLDIGF